MSRRLVRVQARFNADQGETQTFMGREYYVVPVVMLVEGVLQGVTAAEPELALMEEVGKVPQGWDGRPLVMNHPQVDGEYVSANSPNVLTDYQIGHIFGTVVDGENLVSNAWFDTARIQEVGGEAEQTLERVQNGEVVEVSTGLFAEMRKRKGKHKGKAYAAVWANVVPDHLAVLSEGTIGACSIEDGCGVPRLNEEQPVVAANCAEACSCGGSSMPQAVTTAQTPATAITGGGTGAIVITPQAVQTPLPQKGNRDISRLLSNALPKGITDSDARKVLRRALQEIYTYAWLMAVNEDFIVYEEFDPLTYAYKTCQLFYNMADDTTVEWVGEPIEVHILMNIVPVKIVGTEQRNSETGDSAAETPAAGAPSDQAGADMKGNEMADQANTQTPANPTPATPEVFSTVDALLERASPEVKAQVNAALAAQAARKAEVVQKILEAGDRCKFSEAQLNSMALDVLEGLAVLAEAPAATTTKVTDAVNANSGQTPTSDFSGRAPGTPVTPKANEYFTPAPSAQTLFPVVSAEDRRAAKARTLAAMGSR